MGNTENKNKNTSDVQVFHQKFKVNQIIQNSNQMVLSIPFQQKNDILEWQKLLKDVKECDPQFLLMPKKYVIASEGLCGSSGIIKIVFDNFTYSFDQQIKNHAQKFKHFEEAEVWYLTFAILSSIKQMDRLSLKVGDIRPYNIFVNQNGQVKLAGIYSWPKQIQNYFKTSYDKTVTYISPQQLIQCRVGQKQKKSHIIGQSFSVGLTLLHTCLLKPMNDLYNLKKYDFDAKKLESYINQLRNISFWNEQKERNQKYSNELISIIINLLDMDQKSRLTTIDLFNELEPHAQQILNLKQFDFPELVQTTPTKSQQNNKQKFYHEQRISSKYSSIKKKQFNEGQSMGLQMSYGLGYQGVNRQNVTVNNAANLQSVSTQNIIYKSKQNSNSNLNLQNVKIHSRKSIEQRQSINNPSNTIVKFNTGAQGQYKKYEISQPSFVSNHTSIYQGYQTKPVNYVPPNYLTNQAKYQIPQLDQFRNASQPAPIFFNHGTNFTYTRNSENINQGTSLNSNFSYPFSNNINLATSGYTYIDKNPNLGNKIGGNINPIQVTGSFQNQAIRATSYETSIVKPVVINQNYSSNGLKFNNGLIDQNENLNSMGTLKTGNQNINTGLDLDLLRKIDQQLNRSKQLYQANNS